MPESTPIKLLNLLPRIVFIVHEALTRLLHTNCKLRKRAAIPGDQGVHGRIRAILTARILHNQSPSNLGIDPTVRTIPT